MTESEHCALCGMEIHGAPVARVIDGHEVHFDTEACAEVYSAAAASDLLEDALSEPAHPAVGPLKRMRRPHATAFFDLDGMWCASCAATSARVLEHVPGVYDAEISFAAGKGRVDYDPGTVDMDALFARLQKLGYSPRLSSSDDEATSTRVEERTLIQVIVAAAFMMQVMMLYFERLYPLYASGDFTSSEVRLVQYLVWVLATPALFYGGQSFLRGAWHSALARTANMDTLVALGTLAAYSYSAYAALVGGHEVYFDSVVMITTFVMFGRYLETVGGTQARKDVRALLELQPQRAWRVDGEHLEQVRTSELAIGDTIVVKPGERAPVDARVVDGEGNVNEAILTGESVPARKRVGDELLAGTVVTEGALTARVIHTGDETRIAQIGALVQRTLTDKAPVQRLADRVSSWLTFGIIAVALLTLGGWMAFGASGSTALIHAVAVLVVACPCALGLATPLAISVSLGRATRGGVLVRVPAALELAGVSDRAALDKTGTLTKGDLRVSGGHAEGIAFDEVVCAAAGAERLSEHPLGRAITTACADVPVTTGFKQHRGAGVEAVLPDQRQVVVGTEGLMPGGGVPDRLASQAAELAGSGSTIVWVSIDSTTRGFIALKDEITKGADDAVRRLVGLGVKPALLSGDSESTTRAIAEQLGISDAHGRLSPEAKARLIAQWQSGGERVLMVGDGVNDAPALAQADVSVTVSGGTDVASETSDVVLTRSDLALVPWFVELSAITRRVTRQNLGWAAAYNAVAVPLAAFGLVSPAIAAATMALSSLLVVGNSLRLRRLLRPRPEEGPSADVAFA